MPKLKTHRATAKRFRIAGGRAKKFIRGRAGQNHFNAREDGETVRLKRRDVEVDKSATPRLKRLMPYARNRAY
ncbi:MAG: 50S ribosomal protein L35 [Candidatus Andersenbacteria bacterium]